MDSEASTYDVIGPILSPTATYQDRQEYRRNVLNIPGPVDRWLTAHERAPYIGNLQDYLMIDSRQDYVVCHVQAVCIEV